MLLIVFVFCTYSDLVMSLNRQGWVDLSGKKQYATLVSQVFDSGQL